MQFTVASNCEIITDTSDKRYERSMHLKIQNIKRK